MELFCRNGEAQKKIYIFPRFSFYKKKKRGKMMYQLKFNKCAKLFLNQNYAKELRYLEVAQMIPEKQEPHLKS